VYGCVAGEVGKIPGLPIWDGAEKSTPTPIDRLKFFFSVSVLVSRREQPLL
jgi:hypothetical protein